MNWLKQIFGRKQIYDELSEEIRAHLDEKIEELVASGVPREEAEHAARREFGNVILAEEKSREIWRWPALENFLLDVRYALRTLRKSPGFAVVAILTLALGIGGTTAVFTLAQQVMLRSLPVVRPSQLWRIGDAADCCYTDGYTQGNGGRQLRNDWSLFSWQAYKFFRANTPAFENLAAFQIGENNAELAVRRAGSPAAAQAANGEYVSGNFFKTFGISAWRGRLFTDADDREGAPPVAVMSFHTWQRMCGSDPSVVRATYYINGHPFTVIGVTPPGFFGAKIASSGMPDFWLPLTTEPAIAGATSRLGNPRLAWLDLIGRVRPGTNAKALQAQLQGELHQWLASHVPDMSAREKTLWEKQTLHLTPGGAGVSLLREEYKEALRLLLMAAACVLLVACANVANLLLARGLKERHQIALRVALGASRARLLRKTLAESLILSALGAALGVAVAYAGASLILRLATTGGAGWIPVSAAPSAPVLLFALGISTMTGVVFGSVPAWVASQTKPIEALRGAKGSVAGTRHRAQKTLVIAQVAVSLVLLSMAAMLGRSLSNLEHQNFGFDPSGRYLASIDPKASGYKQEQLPPLFRRIENRLRTIPGVRAVGFILEAPLNGWVWPHHVRVEGKARVNGSTGWTRVTPGFFAALGDKIVMGRPLTREDTASTQAVAVVNEAFARRFFGKENPIGHHFGPTPQGNEGTYEIVGVASDVDLGHPGEPICFLPEAQSVHFDDPETEEREVWSHYLYNVVIWAPGNPPGIEAQVRKALKNADPNLVMNGVRPYSEIIRDDFSQQNVIAGLTSLFGAIGLLLAAVGLYGVTAYGVEQRTNEIGVRMALGAGRGSVLVMVLRGAFGQVAFGLALGIPAAIGAGHLIASQLFGLRPWDPMMLSVASALLGLASLMAAIVPAFRALRVDPVTALRNE